MDNAPSDRVELPQDSAADPKLLNSIAWSTRWRNRRRSVRAARRALDLSRKAGSVQHVEAGRALRTLSRQAKWRGDLETAEALGEEARPMLRRPGGSVPLADVESVLGVVYYGRDRRDSLTEGLAIARADGDRRAECQILHQAGALAHATGRYGDAIAPLNKGVLVSRKIGYPLSEQNLLRDLAAVHEAEGNLTMALDTYKSLDRLTTNAKP